MENKINHNVYINDLPDDLDLGNEIAIDTEAMGLDNHRDRLCVVQISSGDGSAHLVHFPNKNYDAVNLKRLLSDDKVNKILHFARFDISILQKYLDIKINNIFCTKIASKLARTYTSKHGLKELCREFLNIELSKQQQSSDWGTHKLSPEQVQYAANDVLYLHQLKAKLSEILKREQRYEIAQDLMNFIPTISTLDLLGWGDIDIFSH